MLKKILFLLFMIGLFIGTAHTEPQPHFSILLMTLDGKIIRVTPDKGQEQIESDFVTGSPVFGAMLLGDSFILFENKYEIVRYQLKTRERESIYQLEGKLKPSLRPFEIIYMNNNRIIFSAMEPTPDTSKYGINKTSFFLIDLNGSTISELPISDNMGSTLSVFDDQMYYSNFDGVICVFNGKEINTLNIAGRCPIVSPNGSKLAYVTTGILFDKVNILNMENGKAQKVISFLGSWTVNPRIRWSSDNRLIAVHQKDDFSPKSLYIIDTENGKIIYEIKRNIASNWFFEN